jgi:hypothetical protein
LHKDIDIGSPVADEHAHLYGANLGRSAGGMVPDPAFRDSKLVRNLPGIQEAFIVMALQTAIFILPMNEAAHALNSKFGRRSSYGFNRRKAACSVICGLLTG